MGIELGGGKSARTSVAVLDYFPEEKKIFIAELFPHVQGDKFISGDEALLQIVNSFEVEWIAIHAPLSLPPCIPCKLACPGFLRCTVPAVKWMRKEGEKL